MYNPHQYYEFNRDWAVLECKDSKTANILINTYAPAEIEVNWGDGLIETFPSHRTLFRKHQYTTPFSGKIKLRVKGGRLSMVKDFKIYNQTDNFVVRPETISQFPKVQTVSISGLDSMGTIIGEFAETLPDSVESLTIANTANTESNATFNFALLSKTSRLKEISTYNTRGQSRLKILGNVTDIPACTEVIKLTSGLNELSGNIADISNSVTGFECSGNLSIYGNINTLKPKLKTFNVSSNNSALSITGNIAEISENLTYFNLTSNNTTVDITGDIAKLPKSVLYLNLQCNNTVYGNIGFIGIRDRIQIVGKNSISGDLTSEVFVKSLVIEGLNTIGGDITSLPGICQGIKITGNNKIYGNIGNIGSRESCHIDGKNTINGELGRNTKVINLIIDGNNEISGELKNITVGKTLQVAGKNIIMGKLSEVPSFIQYLSVSGNNTITGKLSDMISKNISYLNLGGSSKIEGYDSSPELSWNDRTISSIFLRSNGHSMSSAELDQFLNDISKSHINWDSPMRIYLDGANIKPRTSNSDIAYNDLRDNKKIQFLLNQK